MDPKKLPVIGKCDILKEYCRFVEIVEHTYNRSFPRTSFKRAIEKAMKEGILKDYLDRKSREIINMLCAKYDYKMDIAVKQEEAYEDGMKQKATEAARNLFSNGVSIELIAKSLGMTQKEVLEITKDIATRA
ncbi:MAG: hypothetical protein IKX23_09415 [Treponema sp.]|nr:hypothetical protein [Treponema sp.]